MHRRLDRAQCGIPRWGVGDSRSGIPGDADAHLSAAGEAPGNHWRDLADEVMRGYGRGRARLTGAALAVLASAFALGPDAPVRWGVPLPSPAVGLGADAITPGVNAVLPVGIASGSDGNLWFTELGASAIGRVTPAGAIREFPIASRDGPGPAGITVGRDGAMWFTHVAGNRIGRITTSGAITWFAKGLSEAALGSDEGSLARIVAGPDGNLWFTEPGVNRIGRITPAGAITEFSEGLAAESGLAGIAAGGDGNVWFTEARVNHIGRITPVGAITEFSEGLSPRSALSGLAAGTDGNMWFTETAGNRIGRITPAGVITEFSSGLVGWAAPTAITAGPDGMMWFTERGGGIGRVSMLGAITQVSTGREPEFFDIGASNVAAITTGADGNLWFTEPSFEGGERIKRISPSGTVTAYPPPVRIVSVRTRGLRAVSVRVACPVTRCSGTAHVFVMGAPGVELSPRRVGSRRFSLAARRTADVIVPFSAGGRRLIRAVGYASIQVKVRALPSSDLGAVASEEPRFVWAPRPVAATILGVVDGDSVRVRALGRVMTVRLAGVQAPKLPPRNLLDRCFGASAAARTGRLLPAGANVTMVPFPNRSARDELGNLPVFVFRRGRRGPTKSVNYALVATGYARSSDLLSPFNQAYFMAQQRAQASGKGLWGPQCGPVADLPE